MYMNKTKDQVFVNKNVRYKGKKIPMYKLARKHIIISPNKTPSINYLKSILPVILIAAILTAVNPTNNLCIKRLNDLRH